MNHHHQPESCVVIQVFHRLFTMLFLKYKSPEGRSLACLTLSVNFPVNHIWWVTSQDIAANTSTDYLLSICIMSAKIGLSRFRFSKFIANPMPVFTFPWETIANWFHQSKTITYSDIFLDTYCGWRSLLYNGEQSLGDGSHKVAKRMSCSPK